MLKEVDFLIRPGAVTGHRAVPEPAKNGVAVLDDVVVRPEVERRTHRLTVALAEEGLDVLRVADRLLGCGQKDLLYFGLDPGSDWIVGEAAAKNPP